VDVLEYLLTLICSKIRIPPLCGSVFAQLQLNFCSTQLISVVLKSSAEQLSPQAERIHFDSCCRVVSAQFTSLTGLGGSLCLSD
jgi:hypothetical protein